MLDLTSYKLTFDDEFNTRSISQTGTGTTWADIRSQWRLDANSDIGFGNSSFVDPASGYDPFSVKGGALTITAVPDRTPSGYPGSWESGLITTQGDFSQTYGYFEMRADLSDAVGGWDAFWLLPDKPAPNPKALPGWQELDIVEHYGVYDQGVYSTIHTTDQTPDIPWQDNLQVYSELTAPAGYHTYGMDWQKDRISFYVDGKFVGSQATPSDMHGPMHLVANLATQGAGINNVDLAGVPISMKIDYIRAYSNASDAVAVPQDVVSAPDGKDPGLYGATSATPRLTVEGRPGNDTIEGGDGDDKLYGNGGDDIIIDGTGNDLIDGGTGNDTVSYASAQNGVIVTLNYAGWQDTGYGRDKLIAIENLEGSRFADKLTGNGGSNVLHGLAGNDRLNGLSGIDKMYGGTDNDIYYVDNVKDQVHELAGEGTDKVLTTVSYKLAQGESVEILKLDAGTEALNLSGNEFANTLIGNAGRNVLDGKGGGDLLKGGDGNDVYLVDTFRDRVIEAPGQGIDKIVASVSYKLEAGQSVEVLTFTSSTDSLALNLTGNELSNRLIGNSADNVLNGGAGADVLTGGEGSDTFVFSTSLGSGNVDHVTDMRDSVDTIKLSKGIFAALAAGTLSDSAFKDLAVDGARVDADDRVLYNHDTGILSYDPDGNGSQAATRFAVIDTHVKLDHLDFIIG